MKNLKLFLNESNKIEDVFDEDSLEQATYAWEYLQTEKRLQAKEMTNSVVKKAHKILMLHQPLRPNEKGYFRTRPVWVGGREGIKHYYIADAMKVWCMNAWLTPKSWKNHHIRFEHIHPFIDGNGRIGRLLMNWQRVKAGLPIKVIKASKRNEYYKWFKDA